MLKYAQPYRYMFIVGLVLGCQPARPPGPVVGTIAPGAIAHPGVTEVAPGDSAPAAVGKTLYGPVHSNVYTGDAASPFNLAVTLSTRNTGRAEPVVLTSVRYHDSGGRLVRDFLKSPLRLAPLAAMEFFVKQSDLIGELPDRMGRRRAGERPRRRGGHDRHRHQPGDRPH